MAINVWSLAIGSTIATHENATQKRIRFLRKWRGREVGTFDTQLTPGMMHELVVRHRIAEYVDADGKRIETGQPAPGKTLNDFREKKRARAASSEHAKPQTVGHDT